MKKYMERAWHRMYERVFVFIVRIKLWWTVSRCRNNMRRAARLLTRWIEKYGDWVLERLPRALALVAALLIVMGVSMQIGIYMGRSLEREAIAEESAELGIAIASLEAEIKRLTIEKQVMDIIECESRGRHDGVWGDGGKSYGIAQFKKDTFGLLAQKSGMKGLRWKNRTDQVRLLRWAVENGHGAHWTCYKEAIRG